MSLQILQNIAQDVSSLFKVDTDIFIPCRSQCDYNLFEAVKRQAAFYYSVSLPHFTDEKFLQTALARYKYRHKL